MSCSQMELLCYLGILLQEEQPKKKNRRHKVWVKNWLQEKKRLSHVNLVAELIGEPNDYRNYLRMTEEVFKKLLDLISPLIKRQDTVFRVPISPYERLCATLRFLAAGGTQTILQYSTIIFRQALRRIIPETCKAIYDTLRREYVQFPSTDEEMRKIANDLKNKWQFPNSLGAVDGKHIAIIPPTGAGSDYYKYKGFHSVVLMAIANANYEFIYVDVGTKGRTSDGGVLRHIDFFKRLDLGTLKIPPPEKPCAETEELPFVYIGDEAFALRPDFLKPYPQRDLDNSKRIYNYRICRARRIIENAFGILASRFQIFRAPINMKTEHINIVVLACCAHHNYLRRKITGTYTRPEDFDRENHITGSIEPGLRPVNLTSLASSSRNIPSNAKKVREDFEKYFNTYGAVDWQGRMVNL